MNAPHPASLPAAKLLAECDVRHERRSGPGGQHRNKVSTAVVLTHRPTKLRAEANERRSQAENLREALRRLRVRLALERRSAPPAEVPSERWRSRVRGGRLAVSARHEDFPALLTEVIDRVVEAEYDVPAAAERLGISASQLIKFLQKEPAAWSHFNEERRRRGLRPLH